MLNDVSSARLQLLEQLILRALGFQKVCYFSLGKNTISNPSTSPELIETTKIIEHFMAKRKER